MYVVYDAPLVMLSDMPSAYEKEPAALELLAAVPTTWDETIGVDGRIGESVVVARRKGDEWWLGAMTDWTARTIEVPLAFTGGGSWEARSGRTASTPTRSAPTTAAPRVRRTGTAALRLAWRPEAGPS